MTHPLFRKEFFVETAFEKRFQAMLRLAWQQRSWHVIVADPGAGKTMGIRDLVRAAGARRGLGGTTPQKKKKEEGAGGQVFFALCVPRRGQGHTPQAKRMGGRHPDRTQGRN